MKPLTLDRFDELAPGALVAAAALVGVAIALDGASAKAVNGVAGILWIALAAILVVRSRRMPSGWQTIGASAVVGLVLVLLAKPSDLLLAGIGFAVGGAVLAAIGSGRLRNGWLVLPALWLPLHLCVAAARTIERAARDLPSHVRTDPPPTAALVPLAMVVATYVGAWLVSAVRGAKDSASDVAAVRP